MYAIKLINIKAGHTQYWTKSNSVVGMSKDKAMYVARRLMDDMRDTPWVCEVVSVVTLAIAV